MAQLPRKRRSSAVELLNQRSRGIKDAGTIVRHNIKIFRGLLLEDHKTFTRVWIETSKSRMMFENGIIYSDNYQQCFSCVHHMPQVLYKLPRRSTAEKFEDALACQSPLGKVLPSPTDHKPSLLLLTANNWLFRLSAETGQELQRIYLSPDIKFRYLAWNNPQENFVVKSVHNKGTTLQQAGISQDTVIRMAIFKVFPLQIVGVLDITKKVFGNRVTDVVLSQDVLVLSHSNKSVKLYSFKLIVQQNLTEELTLGKQSSLLRGQRVGDAPFGIPVNIQLTDCPPVLLEVSCLENSLQLGGYPWHYIHSPPDLKHRGSHHICSVKDGTLATNGIQKKGNCTDELDEIFFHPDDSGRIIHVRPSVIDVLKFASQPNDCLPSKIVEDFSMTIKQLSSPEQVRVTSRGRVVKMRFPHLHITNPEEFNMLEYEDELDMLAVVVTTDREIDGAEARVHLVDNQSGKLLRIFRLEEPWDDSYRHHVYLDKDTLVHVEEKGSCYRCHVYKLMDNKQVTESAC